MLVPKIKHKNSLIEIAIKKAMRSNHEINYKIIGEEMQCVEIELDPQETVIAEAGSFMMIG